MLKQILAASVFTLASSVIAQAGCGLSGGDVRILGNEFPAIQAVSQGAMECADDNVTVSANLTKEHRDLQVAAMTANPAEYSVAVVANSSIVPLMNDGLIRPLNELVEKYGDKLKKNQLITIDGKIMAVAFMANAQHLFYRSDILEQAGLEVPTSYEEVIAAAKTIKDKGLMEYPLAGTFKSGWNLGEEFVNMYTGTGADMFKPGSAEVAINNENGIKALNMLKELTSYMNPDFLTYDSNAASAEWEAGNVALMNMWGSRAGPISDDEGSTPEIVAATAFTAAPTLGGGSTPATTLWWDGFTIAANISDEDAEASFRAMMNGVDPSILTDETKGHAVWLIDGFEPGPTAQGVFATANAGAKPYPMLPFGGLLHSAAGAELADFLQGKESAEQALTDIEAAYTTAAKEAGFIK
ncbi:extracellular solute-binding protein [uncultured Hoeflea sp.]|uniref:ABC transporter substrate-binding protein n=1 Tax=uncultured Hoeflea sp. TaxID=538666 RepID=UPI0026353ADE|nr:extracellular solute-binding protein [uncultured Hoeflea sp.]